MFTEKLLRMLDNLKFYIISTRSFVRTLIFKNRITLYRYLPFYLRKHREQELEYMIALANSEKGLDYGEFLILKMYRIDSEIDRVIVLYCKPNEYSHIITANIDDLVRRLPNIFPERKKNTFPCAIDEKCGVYTTVQKIGTLSIEDN